MNRLNLASGPHSTYAPQDFHGDFANTHSAVALPAPLRRRTARELEAPFALFAPVHYERGYAYPLVIWLHDDGGNERELRQLMPHVSVRNYVGAAIRGTAEVADRRRGFAWDHTVDGTVDAADRVEQCIAAAHDRYHIRPDRVFIVGGGSGGTMALRLAMQHPEVFAGVASLGGAVPRSGAPLRFVNRSRSVPVLLAAVRESDRYPEASMLADLRLLHSAGFSLSLRQYPGEDDLNTVMLADVDQWIMQMVCPQASAS